ncbi:phosphate ABC transporter substrate-binding protein PstS [Paraferrimonas haliotis]|uniref:phosphate ABC transporter substrate-binding protein PstS n=1 Tax=Paraferrimonas haliotis TaxID=2013866 RepID=UPI000BA97C7C|nr:phosphate ABC transporter substrate-binding protein PstS [Paraferrimonas haliotis]
MSSMFVKSAILLVSCLLVSCSKSEAPQRVVGAGSSMPNPIIQTWIKEFNRSHPDVSLEYQSVGSGEGIRRFLAGEVDFASSSAALTDQEIAQVERGADLIPISAGLIVLAYHLPGFGDGIKLPRSVYPEVFLGKPVKWNDPRIQAVNPELDLPNADIQPVVRRGTSGTTYAFTNHLSAISQQWRESGLGVARLIDWPNAMAVHYNPGSAQRVKVSENALGYMEYSIARYANLNVAALENQAGEYVLPSRASGEASLASTPMSLNEHMRIFIADPTGSDNYPIIAFSWLLTYHQYHDPVKLDAISDLIHWGLGEGQQQAEQIGFIPLPKPMIKKSKQVLDKLVLIEQSH